LHGRSGAARRPRMGAGDERSGEEGGEADAEDVLISAA